MRCWCGGAAFLLLTSALQRGSVTVATAGMVVGETVGRPWSGWCGSGTGRDRGSSGWRCWGLWWLWRGPWRWRGSGRRRWRMAWSRLGWSSRGAFGWLLRRDRSSGCLGDRPGGCSGAVSAKGQARRPTPRATTRANTKGQRQGSSRRPTPRATTRANTKGQRQGAESSSGRGTVSSPNRQTSSPRAVLGTRRPVHRTRRGRVGAVTHRKRRPGRRRRRCPRGGSWTGRPRPVLARRRLGPRTVRCRGSWRTAWRPAAMPVAWTAGACSARAATSWSRRRR